ncbi:hypothetical protein K461DRAFT_317920 [Myriangium duriaei CBS 260.36]|uniref:AD domain-containing protein n=1 Tax=Myriangium duriaei CBS 260.36 TaxID=1168546 RepID=A0A9P4J9P9_9PEZI|nr:hypothetical protein K461DRAFT_317920 [Myriangium duriaei CBS 260.36]
MAETKSRVATPRASGQPAADTLKTLSTAIGARISITTASNPSQSYEGTLFTACPIFNVVAINTAPAPPNPTSNPANTPGDYHIIPISRIQHVQVLSLPAQTSGKDGWASALPAIGKVDTARLREREEQRIAKLKQEESKRGKGVTAEAQALFNAMDRMYAARWHDTDIIVDDAVIISAPYTADSCRAPKGKEQSLAHIRRVVEGERKKIASRGASPMPRKGG